MQVLDINLQEQTANNMPQAAAAKAVMPGQPATATTSPKEDTVKLSAAAQVRELYSEGNSPSEIAAKLKIDIKDVENYLQPGNSGATKVQQPYGPARQTTAASQSNDNTGIIHPAAQVESENGQVITVAQNSGEPSSYTKTINRNYVAGNTVVISSPKL